MNRHVQLAACTMAALLLSVAPLALAQSTAVQVTDPWVRPMGAGADNTSAMYAVIRNAGDAGDTLLSASSPVAGVVELHTVIKEKDGMMKMRPVKGGIAVPAHGEVALKPGGYHVMLIGLKQPIAAGDQVPFTLKFAKAGEVRVMAKAEQRVATPQHEMGGRKGMEGMSGHGAAAPSGSKH